MEGTNLILTTLILLGSILIGIIIDRMLIPAFQRIAKTKKYTTTESLLSAMRNFVIVWILCGGIAITVTVAHPPSGWIRPIQKLTVVALIFSVSLSIAKFTGTLIRTRTGKLQKLLPSSTIIINLTRITIIAIGMLIIFQTLGISITPIITALGIGGLAVALALQDTLSNLFAGIHIILSGQVRPGDFVKLESGEEGYVMDIGWRNTTIRVLPDNLVVVPNAKLSSTIITNYYLPQEEMNIIIPVGVSYNSDLEKVEKVTIEVAKEILEEVPGGAKGFQPFIRFKAFSDYSIDFSVILRVKEYSNQYIIKHEFIKRLHKRYKKEGIEIPFPVRTVIFRKNIEGKSQK